MEVKLEYLFIFDPEKFPEVEKPDEADLMDAKIEFFYPPLEDKFKQRNLVGMAEGFLLFFNSFRKPDPPSKKDQSINWSSPLISKKAEALEVQVVDESSPDKNMVCSKDETQDEEALSKKEREEISSIEVLCREEINVMTLENSLLLIQKFEKKFLVLILSNPKRMRSFDFEGTSRNRYAFPDDIDKEIFSRIMKHFMLVYTMFRGSFQKSFSNDIQRALFSESFVHYIEKYFGKKSLDLLEDDPQEAPEQSAPTSAQSASSIDSIATKEAGTSTEKAENSTPNLVLPSLSNSNMAFNSSQSSLPLNLWEFSIPKIFKGKIPRKTLLMILQEVAKINDQSIYDLFIFHKNDLIYYKKCKELALFFSKYLFDVSDSLNQETCKPSELKKFLSLMGLEMDSHIFYDEEDSKRIPQRFSRDFQETGDSFYRAFNSKEKGKFFQQEKGKGMPFYIPCVLFGKHFKPQHIFGLKE